MPISKKLQITFSLVILTFSLMMLLSNGLFLGLFFRAQKRQNITSIYETVYNEVEESGIQDASLNDEINDLAIHNGAKIVFFDASGKALYSAREIKDYNFTVDSNEIDTKEEYEKYIVEDGTIYNYKEKRVSENITSPGLKSVAIIGKVTLVNNPNNILGYILIYTSIETIDNNIKAYNVFILYETVVFFLIAFLVIYIISNRLVKPIKDVEETTKAIANLDFTKKIDISSHDEIGSLALSINKMSEELERNIKELKEANIKLEKDLALESQINEMRKDFISNISHELKTPISIIGGYSEALKLEGLSKEDIEGYADIIIDEAKKMNKLVRDLLKFAQIESGLLEFESDDFLLKDMVESIVAPLNLEIKDRKIDFKVNVDNITVNGDYDMLSSVLNNYVSNAMHYVDENRKISITSELVNEKIRLYVRNTGSIIKDEDKDRIWESFYKSDKARTRKYGGSGLGLSIVKTIMNAYKNEFGYINMNDGVIFYFDMNIGKKSDSNEQ